MATQDTAINTQLAQQTAAMPPPAPPPGAFDVAGARAAGYSDTEIANYLAANQGFNINLARSAGYNDTELVNHLTGPQASVMPSPKVGSPNGPDDPGFLTDMMVGAGHATNNIINGLTQAWLGITGATPSTQAALKASVDEGNRTYAPLATAAPVSTSVGSTLPALAVPVGGAATVPMALGKLALQGAAVPALSYGSAEDRATSAALGAAGSVAGGAILPVAGSLIKSGASAALDDILGSNAVSPEIAALYSKAQSLGIPVSAAQLSDSKFVKTLASTVESLPFTGGVATRNAQQDAFNTAISRTIGEDTPIVNQQTYATAKTRLQTAFNDIGARNNLQVTPSLLSDLGDASQFATGYQSPAAANSVGNMIDQIVSKIDPNTGTIPGAAYQDLDTQMSNLTSGNSPDMLGMMQLKDALRTAMDSSISDADQSAWTTARAQYRNLKAIGPIIGKSGVDGDISPAALMTRLNVGGANSEAMATGTRGDIGDIAQIGKQFVQDRIPNSGTPQRLIATAFLGGGAGIAGLAPAATAGVGLATTGRVLNTVLNSGASGARKMAAQGVSGGTAAAPATLADLLTMPSQATQLAGSVAGMSLADLLKQGNQ